MFVVLSLEKPLSLYSPKGISTASCFSEEPKQPCTKKQREAPLSTMRRGRVSLGGPHKLFSCGSHHKNLLFWVSFSPFTLSVLLSHVQIRLKNLFF